MNEPAEEIVQRLSREQIEIWRRSWHMARRMPDEAVKELDALCDLALSAESLSRRVAELEAALRVAIAAAEDAQLFLDDSRALCKVQHEALREARTTLFLFGAGNGKIDRAIAQYKALHAKEVTERTLRAEEKP